MTRPDNAEPKRRLRFKGLHVKFVFFVLVYMMKIHIYRNFLLVFPSFIQLIHFMLLLTLNRETKASSGQRIIWKIIYITRG